MQKIIQRDWQAPIGLDVIISKVNEIIEELQNYDKLLGAELNEIRTWLSVLYSNRKNEEEKAKDIIKLENEMGEFWSEEPVKKNELEMTSKEWIKRNTKKKKN